MNVTQAALGRQAGIETKTGQKTPSPAEMGKFDGQLTSAQETLNWVPTTTTLVAEERKHVEELEKEQRQKSFERSQANTELALAMANHQKLDSTRLQANVAANKAEVSGFMKNHSGQTAVNQFSLKNETNQTATSRFNRSMESLKGDAAERILNERVLAQKGHLFNPALAQAKEGAQPEPQTRSLTEGPQESQAKELKSQEAGNFSLNQDSNQTSANPKKPLNLAQVMAQRPNEEKNIVSPFDAKAKMASHVQSFSKAEAAGLTRQLRTLAKVEGPTAPGSTVTGLAKERQATNQATEAAAPRQTRHVVDMKDVAKNMKMMFNADRSEMTVKLNPVNLGRMEIKLRKDGDKVTAELKLESLEAKEAVERQLPELRESLAQQGIQVQEFALTLKEQGEFGLAMDNGQQQGQGQPGQARQSGTGSRNFEPVVNEVATTRNQARQLGDGNLNIYA